MEQRNLSDYLYERLNTAFSINYMVLENFRHVDPANQQGVITRNDIFAPKPLTQRRHDALYNLYAKIRNQNFTKIRKDYDSQEFENKFLINSDYFLGAYNLVSKNPLNYSDVFSKRDIKNPVLFSQIESDINTDNLSGSIKNMSCFLFAYQNFMMFYSQYKMYLVVSDIFNTLSDDISEHGGKTLYYGKPRNKSVYVLDKENFDEFFGPIMVFVNDLLKYMKPYETMIHNNIGSPKLADNPNMAELTDKYICLKVISMFNSIFKDRFNSANKKPTNQKSLLNNIKNDIFNSLIPGESRFKIDKIYIHEKEIEDIISAMTIFPELEDQRKSLQSILSENQQNIASFFQSQKENA